MTWTYDPALLATTPLYQVRWLIGVKLSRNYDVDIPFLTAALKDALARIDRLEARAA